MKKWLFKRFVGLSYDTAVALAVVAGLALFGLGVIVGKIL
jgi:hypothetical protein